MPHILSVSTMDLPHSLPQELTIEFAKELFSEDFKDIERLLTAFKNGQIKKRNFAVPLRWFQQDHSLEERNKLYIENATKFGAKAIESCLQSSLFLQESLPYEEIEAIFFISSTGLATPSMEARIMNVLPFQKQTKRIPIWGLGCAGGAAGLSRAFEYCLAFPSAKVLVLCIELCSLTFQRNDRSKSNLIGTSLFADGIACALVVGDKVRKDQLVKNETAPTIKGTYSSLMPDSEEVMGWDVKGNGLHVVFSRDIPHLIRNWFQPVLEEHLDKEQVSLEDIAYFIGHPGGKKVLDAYKETLGVSDEMLRFSKDVLMEHGNMSSPTVLYVLKEVMRTNPAPGEYGILAALGPGFSSESLLLEWNE